MDEKISFHTVQELRDVLKDLHSPIKNHVGAGSGVYMHTLLVWGLLSRTYELTDSAIWAIDNKRAQTAAHMLRAMIETLAFTYYVLGQVHSSADVKTVHERMTALYLGSRKADATHKSINILTCIDKATKMFPNLRTNYEELSEVVHPNSASFAYSGGADPESGNNHARFGIPFYEFKGDDEKKIINQVGECCTHVAVLCEEIMIALAPFEKKKTI